MSSRPKTRPTHQRNAPKTRARAGSRPATASRPANRRPPSRGIDWRIWAVGVGAVLVVVLVVAFIASSSSSSSAAVPKGTQTFAEKDHDHTTDPVRYDRTPPAGGAHNPLPQTCGIYTKPLQNEHAVHSLEHGAVWITYQPGLAASQQAALTHLVEAQREAAKGYLLLSPYPGLKSPIVASAWGAQLHLTSPSDPRLVEFIKHYAAGNQGGEQGAACAGFGTPDA